MPDDSPHTWAHPAWPEDGPTAMPDPPSDPASLERLLEWIAATPDDRLDDMRHALESIESTASLLDLLHEAVFDLPVTDAGRHLGVLSVLGQLEDPSSIEVLDKFVWLSDADVLGAQSSASKGPCDFVPSGMLQARAAEMLVWVSPGGEEDPVRRILAEHPSAEVRVAAMDAWLFVREDTPEALDLVRQMARDEDAWAVGLPRFTDDTDSEHFDQLVQELTERHGDRLVAPSTWRED